MGDTTPKSIHLPTVDVDAMRDLYERGQYVQAFHIGARHGSINEWAGLDAQLLGGRIAMNLGGMRLGTAIHLRAGRMFRDDATVAPYYVRAILASRGPLAAWRLLRDRSAWSDHNAHAMADWLCLRAAVLARFRDFLRAEAELEAAKRLVTDSPWVLCEQSAVALYADRYEDALRAAEEALKLSPGYRPAIQAAALNLTLLNREEEAMALLTDSVDRIESAALGWQLADLQLQRGLVKQARVSLQRASEHALLADKGFAMSMACHLGDAAYLDGDFAAARSHYARIPKSEYHEKLIIRLEDARVVPKRVALEVGFTRQHHLTCAPATLATLSRYWKKPVDHLELVDQICYDGTSSEAERRWAEESGWRCREFTVTMDSAIAVIDAGVPFTLTTIEPTSGHLQAVIGYDALKQVLLVRDPTWRSTREYPIEWLRERYGAMQINIT